MFIECLLNVYEFTKLLKVIYEMFTGCSENLKYYAPAEKQQAAAAMQKKPPDQRMVLISVSGK